MKIASLPSRLASRLYQQPLSKGTMSMLKTYTVQLRFDFLSLHRAANPPVPTPFDLETVEKRQNSRTQREKEAFKQEREDCEEEDERSP